jgi:short-subunit dehydrogenase
MALEVMSMQWADKVAIVTGASSGIGLAVARELVQRGVHVALVARSADKLAAAARELGERSAPFALDVTDRARLLALPAEVDARFGRLDFIINNAGVNHRGSVRERTSDELAAILETNLVAPVLLTQAALQLLRPGGVVVNLASLAGKVPVPHEATYSASKAGLRAFTRALDVELHAHGIRACTVCPGPVDTGFFGDDLAKVPNLVFSQPMSTAEDVAAAVVRAIETGEAEIDVPALSGKLATLGYLSPKMFAWLRPIMEKRGAKAKVRFLARKRPA